MSYDAIRWAMAQQISKSSTKFLLVAMADCVNADTDFLCWPSCRHLSEITGQDVKTVEAGLRRLRELGAIVDTGDRRGVTGQVIVYRLNTTVFGAVKTASKTPKFPANTPVIGGVEEIAKTPVFPDNTPVFPVKDPQISHETPPKTGDGTSKEPVIEPVKKKEKRAPDVAQISGVSSDLLSDFMTVRKAKKAGALTATAVAGLEREAQKAGLTNAEAITYCIEANWQSFNAGWHSKREGLDARPALQQKPTRHSGLSSMNYSAGVNADGTFA
jgi:hypothetical protein